MDADFEGSSVKQNPASLFHRHSFQSLSRSLRRDGDILAPQPRLDRRYSVCERVMYGSRQSDFDSNFRWGCSSDDENVSADSPSTSAFSPASYGYGAPSTMEGSDRSGITRYHHVISTFNLISNLTFELSFVVFTATVWLRASKWLEYFLQCGREAKSGMI